MFLLPHLGTIIWTTLIFLLLLFILSKFVWKPLLKALSEREQNIGQALAGAQEAEVKIKNLKHEQDALILSAKLEKEKLIKEGIDLRNKIIATAEEQAQKEANKIIEETRKLLLLEKEAVQSEIKNQIATLALEIAIQVVKADLEDQKRQEKLVSELVKEVGFN